MSLQSSPQHNPSLRAFLEPAGTRQLPLEASIALSESTHGTRKSKRDKKRRERKSASKSPSRSSQPEFGESYSSLASAPAVVRRTSPKRKSLSTFLELNEASPGTIRRRKSSENWTVGHNAESSSLKKKVRKKKSKSRSPSRSVARSEYGQTDISLQSIPSPYRRSSLSSFFEEKNALSGVVRKRSDVWTVAHSTSPTVATSTLSVSTKDNADDNGTRSVVSRDRRKSPTRKSSKKPKSSKSKTKSSPRRKSVGCPLELQERSDADRSIRTGTGKSTAPSQEKKKKIKKKKKSSSSSSNDKELPEQISRLGKSLGSIGRSNSMLDIRALGAAMEDLLTEQGQSMDSSTIDAGKSENTPSSTAVPRLEQMPSLDHNTERATQYAAAPSMNPPGWKPPAFKKKYSLPARMPPRVAAPSFDPFGLTNDFGFNGHESAPLFPPGEILAADERSTYSDISNPSELKPRQSDKPPPAMGGGSLYQIAVQTKR
mmetsp:Transcript_21346/g.49250  ORF Transcript_21346/g.49250 Transcript_21346/m.49250 type:complete len:486 (-) Transcript_21346:196-1653(-)|eukprot:CAMPEP_0116847222 /NCGR_PEP_ID=MMETSP0418-20121206/14310_1 /TAXON_ID=1158023 /ORGANISM="Astrosyne radiata, Strain 13vi08-1A" /LENGTH=485 /DNA_ID=CAMNT_0004478635 /DNA_START=122 /DNA_END=1579 /DNA_ORIENTATION=-